MDNVCYYKINLENIFLDGSRQVWVYAILENNQLYELLTNKPVYYSQNKNEFDVNIFANKHFRLITNKIVECSLEEVAIYLRFLTSIRKEELIKKIIYHEESVKKSLNNLDFYENYYVKRMKKAKFLKNY